MEIAFGFCHCGCGNKTSTATQTSNKHGRTKGQPQKYLKAHHLRLSPVDYLIEDRGFTSPCFIWQLAIGKDGYGIDSIGSRTCGAHRAAYERKYGPLPACEAPDFLQLDHLCRVRLCVNPDHLELVPGLVNHHRGKGVKLTPDIVRQIRAAAGTDTQHGLAERFGVGDMCISCILRRVTWKHI
jgi:hypothetical protein